MFDENTRTLKIGVKFFANETYINIQGEICQKQLVLQWKSKLNHYKYEFLLPTIYKVKKRKARMDFQGKIYQTFSATYTLTTLMRKNQEVLLENWKISVGIAKVGGKSVK